MAATTVGRIITVATYAPELFETGDKAGPSLRKLTALGVEAAGLMKDPALLAFLKVVERVVNDLDLGGVVPKSEICTPQEAIKRIAAGDISPDQQRQWDRASGGAGAG